MATPLSESGSFIPFTKKNRNSIFQTEDLGEENDGSEFQMEERNNPKKEESEIFFSEKDNVSSSEEEELIIGAYSMRDRIYKILDVPTFNTISIIYATINFFSIFLSTITFLVSTLPEYHSGESSFLNIIEILAVSIFTIDYAARIILSRKNRIKFVLTFLNIIDLLAIIPFYVELVMSGSSGITSLIVLRVLRLFRVFRILKMAKYSKQLPVVIRATKASGAGFGLALFSMGLFIVLWASAMYYAELTGCQFDNQNQIWRYEDGRISPFQSIPHTLWWTVVTMTTVGYGDNYPSTAAGKIVGSGAIICGILVLAFPLTILAGNFATEYHLYLVEEELKQRKQLEKEQRKGDNPVSPKKILKSIWNELLTLREGLNTSKSVIQAFDRQFGKIELYVQQLEKAMAKEGQQRARQRKRRPRDE